MRLVFPMVIACLAMSAAGSAAAQGLARAGRWLSYDGVPVYPVGFDAQQLAADPDIDYVAALDAFVEHRVQRVRVWVYCWFGGSRFLTPWDRSRGVHDLDAWNDAYWTRLRDFVAQARTRGIIVEVTIFAPYPDGAWWWSNPEFQVAWNRDFNINGAFSANASGHFMPEFFDLEYGETTSAGRTLRQHQEALLDKTLAELGEYENVYFEVCNEFGAPDVERWSSWQRHWASRIDASSPRLVAVHNGGSYGDPTWGRLYWDEPSIDVLEHRFDFDATPADISATLHDAQTRGRILSVNETHSSASAGAGATDFYGDLDHETRYAWGLFLSAAQVLFYEDDPTRIGSAGWRAGAERLRALREVAERAEFWELSPVDEAGDEYDSLVSSGPAEGWQVLAGVGRAYLALFWGAATGSAARIELPSGRYRYEWVEPRDGSVLARGEVDGAIAAEIPGPPDGWTGSVGVVLIVRNVSVPPDAGTTPDAGIAPARDAARADGDDGGSRDSGGRDGGGSRARDASADGGGREMTSMLGACACRAVGRSGGDSSAPLFVPLFAVLALWRRRAWYARRSSAAQRRRTHTRSYERSARALAAACAWMGLVPSTALAQPDLNGYLAQYECRAGNPYCDLDVAGLVAQPCQQTIGASTPPLDDWSAIDWTHDVICIEAGDHIGRGTLTVPSVSGSPDRYKVLRYTRAGDSGEEPWHQAPSDQARLLGLVLEESSHWVIHRLTFPPLPPVSDPDRAGVSWNAAAEGVRNVVFDRLLVEGGREGGFIYGLSRGYFSSVTCPEVTVQNCVFRNQLPVGPPQEAIALNMQCSGMRAVNNEIYDWTSHPIQIGDNGLPTLTGMIVENNDLYVSPAFHLPDGRAPAESLLSVKASGTGPDDPVLILHNRLWGARVTDLSLCCNGEGGNAFTIYQTPEWGFFRDNIVFESQNGFQNGGTRNSFVGNLLYRIEAFDAGGSTASIAWSTWFWSDPSAAGSDFYEGYLNTMIDVDQTMSGHGSTLDLACNAFIDSGPAQFDPPSTGTQADFNAFYGTPTFGIHGTGTMLDAGIVPRAGTTSYEAGTILRVGVASDCVSASDPACFLYRVTVAGTTQSGELDYCTSLGCTTVDGTLEARAVRGPYSFYRRLRTAPERYVIPYAVPDESAPETGLCREAALGSRAGLGLNDEVADWMREDGLFGRDLAGRPRRGTPGAIEAGALVPSPPADGGLAADGGGLPQDGGPSSGDRRDAGRALREGGSGPSGGDAGLEGGCGCRSAGAGARPLVGRGLGLAALCVLLIARRSSSLRGVRSLRRATQSGGQP